MILCEQQAGLISRPNENWALADNLGMSKYTIMCGAVFLSVTANSRGDSGTPVHGHTTMMIGFDAGKRASIEAEALIKKASTEASAAAIKKRQQQKPDF